MNLAIDKKELEELEIVAGIRSPEEAKIVMLYKLNQEIEKLKGRVRADHFELYRLLIEDGAKLPLETFINMANICGITFTLVPDELIIELTANAVEGRDYRTELLNIKL